jgi:hypothetical protein
VTSNHHRLTLFVDQARKREGWSKVWSVVALATACVLTVWFGFALNLVGLRMHY